jgi:hypothetical protein
MERPPSFAWRITIGRGSSINGNVRLTESVPTGSRITQAKTAEDRRAGVDDHIVFDDRIPRIARAQFAISAYLEAPLSILIYSMKWNLFVFRTACRIS